jgi:hypothetical protein
MERPQKKNFKKKNEMTNSKQLDTKLLSGIGTQHIDRLPLALAHTQGKRF